MFWKHPWAWFKDTSVTFYEKGASIAESFRYPPFIAFVLTVHTFLFPITLLLGCIIKFCIDLRARKHINQEQAIQNIETMDADKMDEMITSILKRHYFSEESNDLTSKLAHGKKFDGMESIKLSIKRKFNSEQLREQLGKENADLVSFNSRKDVVEFKLIPLKEEACALECKKALENKRGENLSVQKGLFVKFLKNHGNFGKKMSQDIEQLANEGFTPPKL